MKTYDFIFEYEVKARELENIILIGSELQKRGYTVNYIDSWHPYDKKNKYNTIVAVISAGYNSATVGYFENFFKKSYGFANMQWEQILTNRENSKNSNITIRHASGRAKEITHFSWGQKNYDRLVNMFEIPKENVHIVGHVGLDFLQPEFSSYYLSRSELLKQYNIDPQTNILFFISSFSMVGAPERLINDSNRYAKEIMEKSHKTIIEWFKRLLDEKDDVTIIYRNHPTEVQNASLQKFAAENDRFKLISDYSVKQWILASDNIYNWVSTSLAEIYCAQKSCFMLRPYEIDHDYDLEYLNNMEAIDNYDDFKASIDKKSNFPIPVEEFEQYYYIDKNRPTYKLIADELEVVHRSALQKKSRRGFWGNFIDTLHYIHGNIKKSLATGTPPRLEGYELEMAERNHATREEIDSISSKIMDCIEKN